MSGPTVTISEAALQYRKAYGAFDRNKFHLFARVQGWSLDTTGTLFTFEVAKFLMNWDAAEKAGQVKLDSPKDKSK